MAFGDLLDTIQLDTKAPISEGFGLTINNNQILVSTSPFENPASIGFYDVGNPALYAGKIPIETTFISIQYESSANVYWALSNNKPPGTSKPLYRYVFKVSPSGSTLLSFDVNGTIPVADQFNPANWSKELVGALSLSADGTEVLVSYQNSFRVYRFSKTGTYIGYFDATVDNGGISGISTDGTNLWFVTQRFGVDVILSKRDSTGNILESVKLPNVISRGDIEFDAINYAPKCVIWIREYIGDVGNDTQYAYVVEVPCPNQCQTPPVINATNQCVEQGDTFNPLANVTATDCNGSNIPLTNTNVTFNNVNTEVPGVYTVTYEVTSPSNGLSTKVSINVTVIETGPRYQAISDLIESVALAQTALSHILNAEGEKIQYIVANATTTDEVLAVNQSVECMLRSITKLEMVLQSKLALFEGSLCNACSLEK